MGPISRYDPAHENCYSRACCRGMCPAAPTARDVAVAMRSGDFAFAELKSRPMDQEPHRPIAIGAAIEVHAQVLADQGQRGEAVNYLRAEPPDIPAIANLKTEWPACFVRAAQQRTSELVDYSGIVRLYHPGKIS